MARQGLCECTSGFYSLLKWIVILVNIVLWLFGIAVLAVGIWLYIVSNEYSAIAEGRYLVGSVLLITSGFSVIVIGFLGFVGAIFESTIVLIVYAILIAIASILQLAAGGWAVNQLNFVVGDSRTDITSNMPFYTEFTDIRRAYDHLHMTFQCCGDVAASEWTGDVTGTAPDSCCTTFSSGCGQNATATFYTTGCTDLLATYRQRQLDIIGPLGLAGGIFGIFSGVFAPIVLVVAICKNKASFSPS